MLVSVITACRCVLCTEQGDLSDMNMIDEEVETELVPVPSLPLATLLYSPSHTLAGEMAEVSPLSAAIARHMGINLSPDGIAARNRRGIAIIVHGAPLSGMHPSSWMSYNVFVILRHVRNSRTIIIIIIIIIVIITIVICIFMVHLLQCERCCITIVHKTF